MVKPGFINLEATLESGQLFSHQKIDGGYFEVPIDGYGVIVSEHNGSLEFKLNGCSPEGARRFFDLDYDLSGVHAALNEDPKTKPTIEVFPGLRLLRQNTWEAFVCFILSANNNILRIKKMRNHLVRHFSSDTPYVFPTAVRIAESDEATLRSLGLGYRAPYLLQTCRMIADEPYLLKKLEVMNTEDAVECLVRFPGVGPKVADCILLYGFHRLDVFPMDVWMIKVLKALYFKRKKMNEKKMRAWAMKKWGTQAGYVQQYLFHGARTGLIEV